MSISILLFSAFFGFMVVIAFPVTVTMISASSDNKSTQLERVEIWRASTLVATTLLTLYTYFWVTPQGVAVLIDATTLWVFCGIGVAKFFLLTMHKSRVKA